MSSEQLLADLVGYFAANGLIIELLVSVALFSGGLARRPRFALRVLAGIVALVGVSSAWSVLMPNTMWTSIARFVVLLALTAAAIVLCWRVKARQALFHVVLAAVMQHLAFRGGQIVAASFAPLLPDGVDADVVVYPIALIPFFVGGYLLFARPLRVEHTDAVGSRAILLLLIGMLLSVNVFTNVFDALNPEGTGGLFALFSLLDLVTCVFLLSLTVQIVHRETAERDSDILRHLLHQQKTQMESSRETIELINIKTHDLKKQIALLGDRIPQDEVDELHSLVGIYDSMVRTGNEAMDVLLAEKSLICETRGVRFDRIVDGALLDFMRPGEIYSLFGNAIDNALEAVSGVPEGRYIALTVRRRGGMVSVRVENPYVGVRRFEGDLPVTTKADPRYHGFGMRSMRMIVERYDGHMSAVARNGRFTLTALLPLSGHDPVTTTSFDA